MIPRFRSDDSRQLAVGAARLPTARDTDWILAALHHDDIGLAAWQRLRSDTDLMHLPDGHSRLAPLVYETVSLARKDDALARQLAVTRLLRLAHLRSLTETVAPIIEDLAANGINVMVLKGAALDDVYPSPGQRPMVDIDLLVRPKDLPRTAEILNEHGLETPRPVVDPVQVACLHSVAFAPPEGDAGCIDLHWMASPQLAPPGVAAAQWRRPWFEQLGDDEFWARRRNISFAGIEISAPSITDLLLLVVLHGVRFGIADDTRWAVDAATILRYRSDEIDWEIFVEEAVRRKVCAVTASALVYLNDSVLVGSLAGTIPQKAITRLTSARQSRRERLINRLSRHENSMTPGAPRIVIDVIIRHLVLTANEPIPSSVRSFPWFVALWLGVERPRQIPGFIRRGTWRERIPQ